MHYDVVIKVLPCDPVTHPPSFPCILLISINISEMATLVETVRRSVRAFAQWLSLALEESGETQARIFHLVSATVIILRLRRADGPVKPIETTLVRIAVELDLFMILSDGGPKSVDKLASETGAHPDLLGMSAFEVKTSSRQADVRASTASSGAGSSWSGETDQSQMFRSNEDIKNLYGSLFEGWMQVLVGSKHHGRV